MFSPEDYWKILQYLSGKSVSELDSTIKTLADSERTKTRSLFENTIDQVCFNTEDYKRIRNFLIDWYSGLKTQISLQRHSRDPFVLPPEYLNELIKSFGYLYPADIASINIRVNFFLDLVNLYKIKGTPLSLKRALDYYGLRNVDLSEYWLQKNESGEIIFRGVSIYTPSIKLAWPDVGFETTLADPHWFQSKQDIIQLLDQNKIILPSKTPYFGLRAFFSLSEIQQTISILVRMIDEQYQTWKTTSVLQTDIKLNLLNITVSLLENYLACIYIVNTSFDYHEPALYEADSYLCYDGTSEIVADIINEYETLTSYPTWNADDPEGDKANRADRVEQFKNLFTRQNSQNFIKTKTGIDSAGQILQSINPDFKASIDSWMSSGKYYELLALLLQDLSGWVRTHINTEATDIISIVLGISASPAVTRIINFFKPYRARLFATQFCYTIDNPLFDSIRIYDRRFYFEIIEKIYDYATADSLSCSETGYGPGFYGTGIYGAGIYGAGTDIIEPVLYSREVYDCGSYHDIGIVWDQPVQVLQFTTLRDSLNCHTDTTSYECWYWDDGTATCDFWGSWMDIPIIDSTSDVEIIITGGFRDFDSCGIFDCLNGNDLVQIYASSGG